MKTSQVFLAFLLFGACILDELPANEDSKEKPSWAIAIHGGAGTDPNQWTEEKSAARTEGMRRALRAGADLLASGATAMDTVETVIQMLEDDATFNAGRGAVLTEDGRAELDASIMDGNTRQCGAVAGVTRAKNPISLARRVMTHTKHVLLAGEGADQFAAEQELTLVEPDYFLSQSESLPVNGEPGTVNREPDNDEPHFGTVGCVVMDSHGDLAAGTSTGGTPKKLRGRIGDSPIIGAGTYAANDACAVSGTGIGEEYIRNSVAYDIAAQMRYAGQSLDAAVTKIMRQTLAPGTGGLITISHQGEIVMQHNTPGMTCAAADSSGRFETHLRVSHQVPVEQTP